MFKYKKAQSEIITTVLIILLVLAAIVIVWQVVNSVIKSGSTDITSGTNCIGQYFTVLSAFNGTTHGYCTNAKNTTGQACLSQPTTIGSCKMTSPSPVCGDGTTVGTAGSWNDNTDGNVVIAQRSSGTDKAGITVTGRLFVNGVAAPNVQDSSAVAPVATVTFKNVPTLNSGSDVKVVTILNDEQGHKGICSTADSVQAN